MTPATPLKVARLNAKRTRRSVAIELGVTEETIQNWESGATFPRGDRLIRLARMYRRRPEDLVVVAA